MTALARLVETFAGFSLLSIGGANATVPEIHRVVVNAQHWMSDATFAQLIAIGQTAPGPNVLIVSMIGWRLLGPPGLVAATAAFVLPSSVLAVMVARVLASRDRGPLVAELRAALGPVAVGLMLASGAVMIRAVWQGTYSLAIAAAVAGLVVGSRLTPLWGIAGGALIGLAQHRLHLFG